MQGEASSSPTIKPHCPTLNATCAEAPTTRSDSDATGETGSVPVIQFLEMVDPEY